MKCSVPKGGDPCLLAAKGNIVSGAARINGMNLRRMAAGYAVNARPYGQNPLGKRRETNMKNKISRKVDNIAFWMNLHLFRLILRYMHWAGFSCSELVDELEEYHKSRKFLDHDALRRLARYWE